MLNQIIQGDCLDSNSRNLAKASGLDNKSITWKTEEGKVIKTPCEHPKTPGLDAELCTICNTYWVDNYEIKRFRERKKTQGVGDIKQEDIKEYEFGR